MDKKILITGASGLVGTRLTDLLLKNGYEVCHMSRHKKSGPINSFVWNIENGDFDKSALEGVNAIIHLAGAGVADKRWNTHRKEEILQSRVKSTQLLYQVLKDTPNQVETVVSASAIGYYGFYLGEEIVTEQSPTGFDFLAQVTKQWEEEVDKIVSLNIRTVKLRIGIVLSNKGGALGQMALPVKLGIGSPLATGKQYLSWIHIDDLCSLFLMAIKNQYAIGSINAVTDWASNAEFTQAIASALNKPLWLPNVPGFILKLVVGEMANMIINGSKVSSEKAHTLGYNPQYPTLYLALKNLLLK